MGAVIPPAARKAGVLQGRAVIQCSVGASGGLEGCASVSQEPEGLGFDAEESKTRGLAGLPDTYPFGL